MRTPYAEKVSRGVRHYSVTAVPRAADLLVWRYSKGNFSVSRKNKEVNNTP